MFKYNNVVGTFAPIAGTATINFSGNLYRCIPHGSKTPLAPNYELGARWNPPSTFAVLYACASVQVARQFIDMKAERYGLPWSDRPKEEQPDLLVLNFGGAVADVATDSGLQMFGLPTTYPVGFQTEEAYNITQPIGLLIYQQGTAGLVTRSASASNWSGPIPNWAEVAIFPHNAASPTITERFQYGEWYGDP